MHLYVINPHNTIHAWLAETAKHHWLPHKPLMCRPFKGGHKTLVI